MTPKIKFRGRVQPLSIDKEVTPALLHELWLYVFSDLAFGQHIIFSSQIFRYCTIALVLYLKHCMYCKYIQYCTVHSEVERLKVRYIYINQVCPQSLQNEIEATIYNIFFPGPSQQVWILWLPVIFLFRGLRIGLLWCGPWNVHSNYVFKPNIKSPFP